MMSANVTLLDVGDVKFSLEMNMPEMQMQPAATSNERERPVNTAPSSR